MVIPRLLYIITSVEDKTASASDLHVSLQHFLPVKVVKLRFPASEGKERFLSCSASLSFFCGYLFVMLFKEIPFFFIESFLRFLSNIDTFLGLASFSLRPVSLHLSVSLVSFMLVFLLPSILLRSSSQEMKERNEETDDEKRAPFLFFRLNDKEEVRNQLGAKTIESNIESLFPRFRFCIKRHNKKFKSRTFCTCDAYCVVHRIVIETKEVDILVFTVLTSKVLPESNMNV